MMNIIDCEQGSPEWFEARRGLPTASEFSTVMAKGRGGGDSLTRTKYLYTLAGEILTGEVQPGYTNEHMERGKAMEAEAREMYALMQFEEPKPVGFIVRNGIAGASPDSLIGDRGLLEIKTALPHIQLQRLDANRLPPEHVAQVQGQLWISERDFCDFVSYWPKLPLLCVRVERDEQKIAEIQDAVREFTRELHAIVARYKDPKQFERLLANSIRR
jgi:YqaJ-like viral recombinase domain